MLKKLLENKPAMIIGSSIIGGIVLLVTITAGGLALYKYANTPDKSFDEKFVVEKVEPIDPFDQAFSASTIDQEIAMLHNMMRLHNQQMNQAMSMGGGHPFASAGSLYSLPQIKLGNAIQMEDYKDKYIVTVDLEQLASDEKGVEVSVEPHHMNISVNAKTNKNNIYSSSTISRMISFNETVDNKNIKKETRGEKYIITIPKKDHRVASNIN